MNFLPQDLEDYVARYTSPEPALLAELNRETHLKVLYPRMISGHVQGRILAMFSRLIKPKSILEIGTYTGYSAICFAEGLQENGKLITIEIEAEREDMIRRYLEKTGIADRVDLLIGRAADIVPGLQGPFDLVFLDADKESYVDYYEMVLPKMPSGGVILADNMLWSGRVADPSVTDKETQGLRNFVQHVAEDDRVDQVLLSDRDGIMLIIKN